MCALSRPFFLAVCEAPKFKKDEKAGGLYLLLQLRSNRFSHFSPGRIVRMMLDQGQRFVVGARAPGW